MSSLAVTSSEIPAGSLVVAEAGSGALTVTAARSAVGAAGPGRTRIARGARARLERGEPGPHHRAERARQAGGVDRPAHRPRRAGQGGQAGGRGEVGRRIVGRVEQLAEQPDHRARGREVGAVV